MPRVAIQGNSQAKLQKRTSSFNQETGFEIVDIYTGPKAAIVGLWNTTVQQGYTASMTHEGPHYMLSVQWGIDFVADRWERCVEWAQVNLLQTPGLFGAGSVEVLSQWNADVDSILGHSEISTDDLTTVAGWPSGQRTLYRLKARGMDAFEIKRYVLRLRRTLSANITDYELSPADAVENVYSSEALASLYFIPNIVRLPVNPATVPVDCVWAWKTRTDDIEIIPALNKAMGTKEWVFAAWPETHYNYVG